ncbi:uncharacterized protein LOC142979066 [Anticarsia gemmatalis]|uniref:uncharacterized protein LOC142979066 n=1 Tax=Anticarsia gemmatalis TaxID=129554 RepID=UPI003F766C16
MQYQYLYHIHTTNMLSVGHLIDFTRERNTPMICIQTDLGALLETNGAGSDVLESKVLSRHKRFVAFPEGSTFSAAGCFTVGVIGQPAPHNNPGTFSWGLNWGIAYELPNTTEFIALYSNARRYRQHVMQRKHRRDLYGKLESILNNMGYTGRECILKALCETSQRVPHGENMVEEMFRTVFTMPQSKILPFEPVEHSIYDAAHRLGRIIDNCDDRFHCPLSLIDWMRGYYDAPSPTADVARNPWTAFSSSFGWNGRNSEFGSLLDTKVVSDVSKSKILSRHKRYVAFPEGSSFSVAGCFTVGVLGDIAVHTSPGIYTWAVNWAIAYELPNATETARFFRLKTRPYHTQHMLQRKNRRDLYGKLETILDNMGYSGRECILKTLCETGQRIMPRGSNMIEEMFRTIFTLPQTKILPIEPAELHIYDAAHRLGKIIDGCDRFQCPVSLVDMMKGYYDAPAPTGEEDMSAASLFTNSFF